MPFFNRYFATINGIDQWVRILRLPWEFWDQETLTQLLKHVGKVVRVDHLTLLLPKGKFTGVCLNTDITKPLPGTLKIPTPNRDLIPLIYKGLHEVCALCGSNSHTLEQCPSVPAIPEIEVVVEKFQSHGLADNSPPLIGSSSNSSESKDKCIRVARKKRG